MSLENLKMCPYRNSQNINLKKSCFDYFTEKWSFDDHDVIIGFICMQLWLVDPKTTRTFVMKQWNWSCIF